MQQQILMALLGLAAGFVVASGAVAFLISIGIIPRYAGITRTADRVLLYEDCSVWGAFLGNLLYLWNRSCPLGMPMLAVFGLFAGIYLGSWIIALGEVVDIYAILARRIGLTRGLAGVIACMAAGKSLGSLFYFLMGWGN